MPELGFLTNKLAAALVGVAPFNCDSGGWTGKRTIYGGRSTVRHAIYINGLISIRFDPYIKALYKRMIQKGKPSTSIINCQL